MVLYQSVIFLLTPRFLKSHWQLTLKVIPFHKLIRGFFLLDFCLIPVTFSAKYNEFMSAKAQLQTNAITLQPDVDSKESCKVLVVVLIPLGYQSEPFSLYP